MAYSLLYTLQLGSSKADLTLNADLLDETNAMVASGISTAFTDLGFGNYTWYYTSFPNNFRGYAKVYDSANPSGWNLPLSINPEEFCEHIGSNIVTIAAETEGSEPIPSAQIEIYPSGSNLLLDVKDTNTSTGIATFNLDDGNYEVYASKPSIYSFESPIYISVAEGETDFAVTGVAFAIPSAPSAGLARIYTFLNDLGLDAKEGVKMLVTPSGLIDVDEELVITKKGLSAVSDSDGYVYMDVAASVPIRIKIPDANYDRYVVSPASGMLNVATLVD